MKNIQINDLYNYNFLSGVEASPNGKKLLFVKTNPNSETHEYDSRLYCMDINNNNNIFPLTSNGNERSGFWLNDDEVLFMSENKGDKTVFAKLNVNGGEAEKAFTITTANKLSKIIFIKKIHDDLFVVIQKHKPLEDNIKPNRAIEGEDYLVFDELPFWFNGQGIINKVRNLLCLYTPSSNKLEVISNTHTNVDGVSISDDKSKLLYWGSTYTDVKPVHAEIFEYHIGSDYTEILLNTGALTVNFAKYINNKSTKPNNTILFEGSDKKDNSSQNPKLYLIEKNKKSHDNNNHINELLDLDGSLNNMSGSDITFGGGNILKVLDNKIYCLFTSWGNSYLSKLDNINSNIKFSHINQTIGTINCFDIIDNFAYCVAMRDYEPQELYKINLTTGEEFKLTSFNQDFINNYNISKPEYFRYTTKNNIELEGWVIKPANFNSNSNNKKYAGVLSVHGGPKAVYGTNFNHEMQCMATRDMFVFYTNPRGSDGRGEEFSHLAGKLGEIDFDDLMDFTDEVLKRYPLIDENRLGITGGSYGGFICNWAIGHTDRFKVATSQRSISNYISKCLSTDIGYYHNLSQTGADPWTNPEKMWYHSPLKYVKNAKTPTLFIQSDEDYRCWLSEPLQMFSALCENNVPTKMALFHGENHELSRSGKLKNRINRLIEICDWLEKYLNI